MEYALIYTFGNVIEQISLRYLMDVFNPFVFILYFYIFGTMAAFGYAIYKKEISLQLAKKTFRNKWSVAFVLAESLGTLLWLSSIWYIGISGMAAFGVMPKLFKMYYGVKVFGESMTTTQVILGIGVAIAAVIFGGYGDADSTIGAVLAVITALSYTVAGIAQKHIAGRVAYSQIMAVRNSLNLMFIAGIVAFSFFFTADVQVADFNISTGWLAIIALLAFYGNLFLRIMKLKSNETVPLSTLVVVYEANAPVLFIAGFLILGETMTWPQGFAAVYMMFVTAYFVYINKRNAG